MITPQQLAAKYKSVQAYLEPLRLRLRDDILAYSEGKGFASYSRVKSLASLAEKIESGRYSSWSELDDLVAFTVVIPTLSQESEVLEFLDATFERIALRRRGGAAKAPDVFRFDSTRFIGRLSTRISGEPATEFSRIKFEVQIKSAFEHAWASTTHALTYKGSDVKWSKLRLTAQLKAAVEQLDMLVLAFEETSLRIEEGTWPEVEAKATLSSFFQSAVDRKDIPEELAPKDWSRFCDNAYAVTRAATRSQNYEPNDIAKVILGAVAAELAVLGPDMIPRSISLWQLTFGALCKYQVVKPPLGRFVPLITPELESLYPAVSGFTKRFDFST